MKILIFRERSLLPGRRCWDDSYERREDVVTFEGEPEHLAQQADVIEHSAHPTSTTTDLYKLHLVQTIREALGIAQKTAGRTYEDLREGRSKTARREKRPPIGGIS